MKCSRCLLPIHESEVSLRHIGVFTAHSEHRCVELLRLTVAERDAEIAKSALQIAAAEEMYAALQVARDRLYIHQSATAKSIVTQCDAALRKADGGVPCGTANGTYPADALAPEAKTK